MHGIVMEQLVGSRMPDSDSSTVVYDLRHNTDYLTPKELGMALSEVFFENDGVYWFSVNGKNIMFTPGYKVKFLFPVENEGEARTVLFYFSYNLEHDLIPRKFAEQLKGTLDESYGLIARTRQTIYSAEFKNDIMENIEIEYV